MMIKMLKAMVNDCPWKEALIALKIAFNNAMAIGVIMNKEKWETIVPGVLISVKISFTKMDKKELDLKFFAFK